MDLEKLLELLVSGGTTLGAAYWGAHLAFSFNAKQQKEVLRTARIEECNRAMLALFLQLNSLVNYRDQFLSTYREHPGRHLQVRASTPFDPAEVRPNPAALAFLLGTDSYSVPGEVALLDAKYRGCIDIINHRSRVHLEHYQPVLEQQQARLEAGATIDGQVVERALGPRYVGILKSATDDIYERIDSTIAAYSEAGATLHATIKIAFPEAKVVKFAESPAAVSAPA